MSAPSRSVRLSSFSTSGIFAAISPREPFASPPSSTSSFGTTLLASPIATASAADNLLAGEHDLLGAAQRHLADHPLRAAGAGKEPEGDLREAEPGGVASIADVGRENELGAAAQRKAVDRGDGRLVADSSMRRNTRCTTSANSR